MNTQQSTQQHPLLTKQQLFVNPMSIVEKQKAKQQPINQHQKTMQQNIDSSYKNQYQTQNFSQILLHAVNPQSDQTQKQPHKSKHIFKKQSSLSASQLKQKNYRTRMCPYGIQCKKRLICQFAHNQFQLRRPYKNRKNPCIRYQKGLCSLGSACPDYHGNMDLKKKNYKYKVEKCKEWVEKGTCDKGKLCIFVHDEDEEIGSEGQLQSEQNLGEQGNINELSVNHQIIIEQNNDQSEDERQLKHLEKDEAQFALSHKSLIKHQFNKDIFQTSSQKKKPIIVTEVVENIVEKIEQKPSEFNQNQQDNFNIQFNF